jgi:hypothetical protein
MGYEIQDGNLLMATYTELRDLYNNAELRNRVSVACTIWANTTLTTGTPTTDQIALSKLVLEAPDSYANTVTKSLLAEFNTSTVGQITGATDSQIQTQVDQVLNKFVGV